MVQVDVFLHKVVNACIKNNLIDGRLVVLQLILVNDPERRKLIS